MYRFIYNLTIRQKVIFCLILGGIMSFAMAPSYLVFCLFALPFFIITLQSAANIKQSFILGFSFGLGFFTCSLYWISFALHAQWENYWWALPLALLGLPFLLSFFPALSSALTWRLSPPEFPIFPLFFALSFSIFEFIRGHIFTGFPWNVIGHTWGFYPEMMQIVSIFGIYGLSLLTLIAFSLSFTLRGFLIGLFILSSLWNYGHGRIPKDISYIDAPYNFILVQPNIAQIDKWKEDLTKTHLEKLLLLSNGAIEEKQTNIIIWPETALTFFPQSNLDYLEIIKENLPKDSILITGGIDISFQNKEKKPQIFNSVFVGHPDYKTWQTYDKSHLVPFGEYIPLKEWIPFLPLTGQGFTAGDGVKTMILPTSGELPSLSMSPLVCYEAIFSGQTIEKQTRPDFILNVTNDAWYLKSIGPYQHHDNVRFRAVEEGIPLFRVANTGISSVVDSYGRVLTHTELQNENAIRSKLPSKLQNATLFAKYREQLYFLLVAFFGVIPLFYKVFRFFF